jgi:hypothetical protein
VIALTFGWKPGLALDVDYSRTVREEGARPGQARFGRRFRWTVEAVDGGLAVRPSDIVLVATEDDRAPLVHRRFYDALIDAPPDLVVGADGRFLDLADPGALAAAADISSTTLRALPLDARRVVAGLAHPESLRSMARDLWTGLVQEWVALGTVPQAPVVDTVPGQLPMIGVPARFVLTRTAESSPDGGVVLSVHTEPLADDLTAALRGRPGPIRALHVDSRTTLHTDPETLVPRALEVRRRQEVAVEGAPSSGQLDVRTWRFRPATRR